MAKDDISTFSRKKLVKNINLLCSKLKKESLKIQVDYKKVKGLTQEVEINFMYLKMDRESNT